MAEIMQIGGFFKVVMNGEETLKALCNEFFDGEVFAHY
jgi:hypothetical protein